MKSYTKTLQIVLPDSFQEILIANEMRYERGDRSVHLIRNLLYLYSIGTEYYDTINNSTLHSYYKQKSDALIRDSDVIAALEKHPKHAETIELFEENNLYKIVKKGDFNDKKLSDKASCDSSEVHCGLRTSPSISFSVESNQSNEIAKFVKNKCITSKLLSRLSIYDDTNEEDNKLILTKYKSDIDKFENKLNSDIKKQKEKFEKRKKQRQLKQYLIKKRKLKSYIKRSKEVLIASCNIKYEETNKILDDILELTEKRFLCDQRQMEKEIESFINKNLQEMHTNINELRDSLVKEAIEMEESGFPQIAKMLYADIEIEIEGLKEQYEESRLAGIERIRNKFIKGLK